MIATTRRWRLDVTDSGHASAEIDTSDRPDTGMAMATRQRFVIELGQGRPNVHAPTEHELAPATPVR